jgi:hypothetical protein
VRPLDLRTGRWFDRVLTRYLRSRPARPVAERSVAERRQKCASVVRRNATQAAVLGAATAGLSTAAAVLAAETPAGALTALPVAACGVVAEMVARAVLHVRMSCALADVWGLRFSPDDPEDLARLYALAFDVEEPRDEAYGGRAAIERLARGRNSELGNAIGAKLLSESILRNIPFIGIFTSAVQSWSVTMRVGNGVTQYLHSRLAFDEVLARVARHGPAVLDTLIEGVWFISTADAQVDDDETALLAYLVQTVPRECRWKLIARFVPDEEAWIERLAHLPEPAHDDLLRALEVAAAMDGKVTPAEQMLLTRAAAALGIAISSDALARVAVDYRDGIRDGG